MQGDVTAPQTIQIPSVSQIHFSLNSNLRDWQRLRLDPRMFGCPNRRARCWRICYLPSSKQWSCKFSLQELAGKLLAPMNVPLRLDFTCYWSLPADEADQGDVFETDLSEWQHWHLTRF